MKMSELCSRLDARLVAISSDSERLETIAGVIGQVFKVSSEDVAVFICDEPKERIYFLWPLRLRSSGFIPMTSHNSLAVRTIRENRPDLNNSFSSTPHASIFERVSIAPGVQPLPIQKIMSVPLPHQGKIIGALQVSRKGESLPSAGEDFTVTQLDALGRIAACVARFIIQSS
ncbi:MAG: GAF domain-containing protein [Desulfuromonadaceae bacterium]|nr:GAF domain-containing protein [Desulfuromonadaceae bacterium]MDD5106851.1 GAF domain-containing protein [Desulfuromonadaceae bacterium]